MRAAVAVLLSQHYVIHPSLSSHEPSLDSAVYVSSDGKVRRSGWAKVR